MATKPHGAYGDVVTDHPSKYAIKLAERKKADRMVAVHVPPRFERFAPSPSERRAQGGDA